MATRKVPPTSAVNAETIDDGEAATWQAPINGAAVSRFVARDETEGDVETGIGDRIRDLVAQSGADRVKVKVYRRNPRTGKLDYCQDYSPDAFDDDGLSMLREDWGAGDYELRVIGSTGILARPSVSIAPLRTAPAVDNSNSEMAQMLRMLAEGQQRMIEALSTRPDPTVQLQSTLALMVSMREAMGLNQAPAPAQSMSSSLSDIVAAVRSLREVSNEITPKDPDPDNPMALAMPILEVVKTAMQNRQPQPQPQAQPQPQPVYVPPVALQPIRVPASLQGATVQSTAPVHVSAPQPESKPVNDPEPTKTPEQAADELRGLLAHLVGMAQTDAPIETAAEFVADNLPDELLMLLESPYWFPFLSQVAPEVAPHESYFRKVKDRAVFLLYEAGDEAGESGETSDPV